MNTLFIDIETIQSFKVADINNFTAPANYKDAEKIEAYKLEAQKEELQKTPLKSLRGHILCIGFAENDEDVKCVFGNTEYLNADNIEFYERTLLERFANKIKSSYDKIAGHYIKQFDIPFILHRAYKYRNYDLINLLKSDKWGKGFDCTHEMFAGTDTKNHYSLKDIANFFGIENHKNELDGSHVQRLFEANELHTIEEYCKADVELERIIYNLLKN